MATGTFYLRPSADVSLGHTVYPSSLSTGYSAISEVSCDGGTTYIEAASTTSSSTTIESTFKFSGSIPPYITNISSAKIVYAPYRSTSGVSASLTISVNVNGNSYASGTIDLTDYSGSYTAEQATISGLENAIKNYVLDSDRNTLELNVSISSTQSQSGSYGKGTATQTRISQMYLELVCEYTTDIGVYKKINNAWTASKAAYQKVNGTWTKITASECINILRNNNVKP